jgi:hypothetical protein
MKIPGRVGICRFSLNILLALFAHLTIADGDPSKGAIVTLVLVLSFPGKKYGPARLN